MRVAVYAVGAGGGFGNKRARYIATAFLKGLQRSGVQASILNHFDGVRADVAVAYGWVHESIFTAYKKAGAHYVYWDLGYWNRRPRGVPQEGHHRLAIDDWDTAHKMARECPLDRFNALDIPMREPTGARSDILVAGMSEKAAGTHGYAMGQWESMAVRELEAMDLSQRIILRHKPNKRAPADRSMEDALQDAHLLVTHHSNAAVDALVAGVPCYARKGIGVLASPVKLTRETVLRPHKLSFTDRLQLLADVAYAQWTPEEMRTGRAWDHIRGLLG